MRGPSPRAAGLASALLVLGLASFSAIPPSSAQDEPRPLPAALATVAAPPGAIEALNLSPTSRTVRPTAVQGTSGSVANPQNVLTGGAARISGTNSSITLDFGKEVGGIATLSFGATSGGQQVGLAFTESSLFIGRVSDASNGGSVDGAIFGDATTNGTYVMPAARLRGGFRYLTIFLSTSGWVDLTGVSLNFTPAPGKANPAAYANYFYSSDNLLNRIWYAGAYTVQMNIIASNQGRIWPPPPSEWDNSATVGVGNSVLVDGAKRGETIQPNAWLSAALPGGASLATVRGATARQNSSASRAAALKPAANARLWDANVGMYRDNPTSSLYPQDGNSLAVWFGLTDSPDKSTSIVQRLSTRWNTFGATTPEWGGGVHPYPGGMEVHAHFVANDDFTALAQIRRTWGYMLDSPIGTRSTFWEGINADGSLAYSPPFMSLSHGWSSGPTSALTFYVLGTAPETQVGQYRFVPHPGDLTSAEGRITLPQGQVNAAWSRNPAAGTYTARLTSPGGTTGRIGVPKLIGTNVSVSVNGTVVWSNGTFTPRPGIGGATQDSNYVYLTGVVPGTYDITASGLGTPTPPPPPAVSGGRPPRGTTRPPPGGP